MEAHSQIELPPSVPANGVAIYLAAIAAIGLVVILLRLVSY